MVWSFVRVEGNVVYVVILDCCSVCALLYDVYIFDCFLTFYN